MKLPLPLGVLALTLMFSPSVVANPSTPTGGTDSVVFLGQTYCLAMDWCPDFAFYGAMTPAGYVELTEPDGTPSDYLWADSQGYLTFESTPLNVPPPPGLPMLGKLVEDGTLQEVDQFFPAGRTRPLFMQSPADEGLTAQPTPEPSTLWLLAPAAGLAYHRVRRSWRV